MNISTTVFSVLFNRGNVLSGHGFQRTYGPFELSGRKANRNGTTEPKLFQIVGLGPMCPGCSEADVAKVVAVEGNGAAAVAVRHLLQREWGCQP